MNSPIVLALDQGNMCHGLHFERDGKPVDLETAFREGFTITRDDAPAALTLLQNFVKARDENQK